MDSIIPSNPYCISIWSMMFISYSNSILITNKSKRRIKYNLQRISKQDFDFLISKKILRLNKIGNYKDPTGDKKIVVTGSYGSKSKKQRYVQDALFYKLEEIKNKDIAESKLDLSLIKDNQRYLFSDSNISDTSDSVS